MGMRFGLGLAIGLMVSGMAAGPALAQNASPATDARDKMVAKDATDALSDWREEPWWIALADCAAAFKAAPEDPAKLKAFSLAAIKRVSADRAIDLRAAAALVMPYATQGLGVERAQVTINIFGAPYLQERCDGVLVQYRAAFP